VHSVDGARVMCVGIGGDVGPDNGATDGRVLQAHAGEDPLSADSRPVFHAWAPQGLWSARAVWSGQSSFRTALPNLSDVVWGN